MNSSDSQSEKATPLTAIVLVFAAGLIFSFLDSSAKQLGQSGMAPPFIAWARFAGHVALALLFLRAWSSPVVFATKSLPQQVLRGLFLFGSTFFNFMALRTLQLAETVSIMFFAPMVTTALAGPLLGEWAGWRRWLAVAVGLVGVLVITRPGVGAFQPGHAFALCGMACYSFYVLMTRRMGATETSESLIFYSALTPVVLMAPALPLYATMPASGFEWFLLVSLGFYGGLGHWLLIKAYRQATTGALAPYSYLQLVWMVALGWLFFGDLPDRWTVAGGLIIVASGLYIVHRERRLRLKSAAAPNAETGELAKKL